MLVACVAGPARAAPVADVVVMWAPGADPAPVAVAARELGAALIDRSPARTSVEPIAPLLQTAIDAYEATELDRAWTGLERVRDAADRSGGATLTTAQLSDVFLYRGLVRSQREDAGAWEELVAAIVVDPTRVLDPARFPPKVIELAARARTEILARPRATLGIDAPAGCRVTLDGRAFDSAVPQVPGSHWVRVECADHAPWGARVTVTEPQTRVIARVEAFAPPTETDVLVQARTAGARAVIVAEVRRGVATVRLVGIDGRERDRRTVAVATSLEPLADAIRVLGRPEVPRRERWYRSRWAYAAGAAVLVAGILIPIAIISAGDDRATAGVGGPRL